MNRSRSRRRPLVGLVFGTLLLAGLPPAEAQNADRQRVTIQGKLQNLRPGFLQVTNSDGAQWIVKVEATPENIQYVGTADPRWLRPGLFVRFAGNFNSQGQAQMAVNELTVFTPQEEKTQFGVFPDSGPNLDNLFAEPGAEPKEAPEFAPYLVVGRLTGIRDRQIAVFAGRVPVRVELAENVRVSLDLADYSLARPGDQVEIQGWHYPQLAGQAIAERLKITAAEPLAAPETAQRGRRTPDRERTRRQRGGRDLPEQVEPQVKAKEQP